MCIAPQPRANALLDGVDDTLTQPRPSTHDETTRRLEKGEMAIEISDHCVDTLGFSGDSA
jgi:hypothetical protein